MIVICGATGRVGGTALRALQSQGLRPTALVRDAAKAAALRADGFAVTVADLEDERTVVDAFRGADRVLALCPVIPGADDVMAGAQRMIDVLGAAIDAARPRTVVAISDYGAHVPAGTGITMILRRLEERLREIPVATTFIRSAEHMQNWRRQWPVARAQGVLPSLHHPVDRRFPMVSAFDVGTIAAELLAAPTRGVGVDRGASRSRGGSPRVVHVEGPRRASAADVAAAFAQRLGRPVVARELPRADWEKALAGLGTGYAHLVAELQDAHNAGLIDVEPGGVVRRGDTELVEAIRALQL
jgi:NAD(P)H dehydrogenase (quinone)